MKAWVVTTAGTVTLVEWGREWEPGRPEIRPEIRPDEKQQLLFQAAQRYYEGDVLAILTKMPTAKVLASLWGEG
jgi:hypothetical protein